jgi:hypothetical protein
VDVKLRLPLSNVATEAFTSLEGCVPCRRRLENERVEAGNQNEQEKVYQGCALEFYFTVGCGYFGIAKKTVKVLR